MANKEIRPRGLPDFDLPAADCDGCPFLANEGGLKYCIRQWTRGELRTTEDCEDKGKPVPRKSIPFGHNVPESSILDG